MLSPLDAAPANDVTLAVKSITGALLVGLLIGAQRETAGGEHHPGLRDFLLISLAGGVCGVLGNPWLDAAALLSVTTLFAVLHYEQRVVRAGITTELAAMGTFLLALFAANQQLDYARPVAIGVTIVVAIVLEARERLQSLLRTTFTVQEFNATLGFVALILVIYPLLPAGSYGPYSFFSPRQVWMFVILISSISYLGYFFEKFLGQEKGMLFTSLLGGLASTTAATAHFAKLSKERPEDTFGLWRAFVIANTVQFPRTFLIIVLVNQELARASAWPLASMLVFGVVLAEILRRWPHKRVGAVPMQPGNPFRLQPALRFGLLFTAVVFLSKAATARLGAGAFYATSLLGGLVDVATVIAPAADLLKANRMTVGVAEVAVLLALASNAVLKIGVSFAGTREFIMRVAATFGLWMLIGAATWWVAAKWIAAS